MLKTKKCLCTDHMVILKSVCSNGDWVSVQHPKALYMQRNKNGKGIVHVCALITSQEAGRKLGLSLFLLLSLRRSSVFALCRPHQGEGGELDSATPGAVEDSRRKKLKQGRMLVLWFICFPKCY